MVSMLTRMLLRDLWHLRGQVMAAALVVACGIGALVATRGTYQSLLVARADYYAANRFADVFARLKRAPESLAEDIRRVSGVAQVTLPSFDVVHSHSVTRLSLPGPRASLLRTSSG